MNPEDFTRHAGLRSSGYELMAYGPLSALFLVLGPSVLMALVNLALGLFAWVVIQRRLVKMWGPLQPTFSPVAWGYWVGAAMGVLVYSLGFDKEAETVFLLIFATASFVGGFMAGWREWILYGGSLIVLTALDHWGGFPICTFGPMCPEPWTTRVWILATMLGPAAILVGARSNAGLFWPRHSAL